MKAKTLVVLFFISFSVFSSEELVNKLKLKGSGDLDYWIFDVYTAKLFTNGQKNLYDNEVILELKYKRDLVGPAIADRSVEEMIKIGVKNNIAESYRTKMRQIFPDVKDGVSLSAYYRPGKGIVFYKNHKEVIGHIKNDQFAKDFLDIWLSPKTSEPELRKELLGG